MTFDLIRRAKAQWRGRRARMEIAGRPVGGGRVHGLGRPLVISLTSYPARFPVLHWTLRGILRQSIRPDVVVLWIATDDMALLPSDVIALQAEGLQIRPCADLRSYKKIIPTLTAFPESLIVTADDDVYYWPTWLEELVTAHFDLQAPIVCHRARQVKLAPNHTLEPYATWPKNRAGQETGPLLLPTGVQGVLYDPHIFHSDVGRADLFMALAPTSDDIWLYWMHRLNGSKPVCLGLGRRIVEWPDSQAAALQTANVLSAGNDAALAALTAYYGLPPGV